MKKLTKVIFIAALLAMVVLPLSAKKAMVVSWEWELSDSDVTAYRYQLNGEEEDGWTVVDGTTASYTARGLDPYSDYTLYLQSSYDGLNWSESASSTAYALLVVGEEPVEEVVEPVEEEVPAVETLVEEVVEAAEAVVEAVEEAVLEKVEETPVEEEPALPVEEVIDFYLFGVTFHNTYCGTTFTSSIDEEGYAIPEDILDFINYENEQYSYLVDYVTVDAIEDGKMVLTVPEDLDFAGYMDAYKSEIEKYLNKLIAEYEAEEEARLEAEKAAAAAAAEAEAVVEEPVKVEPAAEAPVETAVEEKKAEETPVPAAPSAVEATPVKEEKKESAAKASSFNLGLALGAEWGFNSISDIKNPAYSYLPRAALTIEGQNLLHFGAFGLGVRSDVSCVVLPDGLSYSNILQFSKMGFDITGDVKLMAYINSGAVNFRLGGGLGYSLATSGKTSSHTAGTLASFDTGYAITAVAGFGFNLGSRAYLSLEGYGRHFFGSFSSFKLSQLSVAATLGFGFRF